MKLDEGYIKFQCDWEETMALPEVWISELNAWRQRLYAVNLIGAYEGQIGLAMLVNALQVINLSLAVQRVAIIPS